MGTRRARVLRGLLAALAALLLAASIPWQLAGPGALFLARFRSGAAGCAVRYAATEATFARPDGRALKVRTYAPAGGHERVALVIHGVHRGGYDEKRLVYFALRLVEAGYAVVTPELDDLKRYEIAPRSVDDIAALIDWTAALPLNAASTGDGRIGLVGISFAGGLAISAAGRPGKAARLAWVFAFGGHGDLKRTMRFLARGERTAAGLRAPHVYGQAVEVRMLARDLVPAGDVAGLRDALLAYLEERTADADRLAAGLGPRARELVRLCRTRDSETLGAILAPLVERFAPDPALSPEAQPAPRCPVFLLHGADDDVIPASETRSLAAHLARDGDARALVTDLIQHVELKGGDRAPPLASYWRIARFWTALLGS